MAPRKGRRKAAGRRSAAPLIAGLAAAVGLALIGLQLLPDPGPATRPAPGPATPLEEPARPARRERPPEAPEREPRRADPAPKETPQETPKVETPKVAAAEPTRTVVAPARQPRPERRPGVPKVAIVIDDCGYDPELARRFARLPIPITFAVIPHLPGSEDCAEVAFSRGHEVILHQPMEPDGYPATKPGEGAIMVGMGRKQVVSTLAQNLRSIPHVSGLNNHMGSAATADPELMEEVLGALTVMRAEYPGLYFLDSKTSPHTVAYDTARKKGLPAAMRSVFLDHDLSPASVKSELEDLLRMAEEEGEAIGIGHVKVPTLQALEAALAGLGRGEFEFVFASELAR